MPEMLVGVGGGVCETLVEPVLDGLVLVGASDGVGAVVDTCRVTTVLPVVVLGVVEVGTVLGTHSGLFGTQQTLIS